ncbi:hypothetical protein Csa_003133 [Cucumis sativus]|uniref:Uncharacterized protein n=1 Tax=Cucumis sativus TaxID=3659 RepID=A0A0A0KIX4_CUCSA|nr:hypothetical protein Csa_003133 [Cucumis sativus]
MKEKNYNKRKFGVRQYNLDKIPNRRHLSHKRRLSQSVIHPSFFRIFHNETLKRFPIFSSNHIAPPHSPLSPSPPSPIFIFRPGVSSFHTLPESFRKTPPKISTLTSLLSSFFVLLNSGLSSFSRNFFS